MDNIGIICSFLDENEIEYEKFNHESVSSIEECKQIESTVGGEICKNLLLRNTPGTAYFLLSMKGEKAFVTKDVSKKLGSSRLSFVSAEEMQALVNTLPGSLGIMSLIFDKEKKISFAVDKALLENEFFLGTGIKILPFSSVTQDGKAQLWNEIYNHIEK
jgi:Ala-tRNA(Pro) deacylase